MEINSFFFLFLFTLLLINFVIVGRANERGCNNELAGLTKTPGDNGFKIQISGNPSIYTPTETYSITLQGIKTHASVQKFTAFKLSVESSAEQSLDVGTFHLHGDALTRFPDRCPNVVVQTSVVPKSAVHVQWKAPARGSGCVHFKASLLEIGNKLYSDDGELSKQLCEEGQELDNESDVLKTCHACDEAKYEVTFQGIWSRHTHPKDFPEGRSAHFSDIIGASHGYNYTMWKSGVIASRGLREVAEYGLTRTIEAEMKEQSNHIRTIIKARGLWYPNLNGSTFAVFRVDHIHHLVSLVTMIGPSPDWITGLSRMELCQKDRTWVEQKTVNLYPWDAGTDGGVTYLSPDMRLSDFQNVSRITSTYPNHTDSPFYDPTGKSMNPVAKLIVTRQRLYEKACGDEFITDNPIEVTSEDPRMECVVTDWNEFSECSVTCGKGLRIRTREYLMPTKAAMVNCETPLEHKEMCMGAVSFCDVEDESKQLDDPEKCKTTNWSEWSECSVTCEKGFRQRTRKFLNRKAFKTCYTKTIEREQCMADVAVCEKKNEIDPQCQVTQWSEWSPCMVTCGKGMQLRTRLYLSPKSQSMCNLEMLQRRMCMADRIDCSYGFKESMQVCNEPRDSGPCRGSYNRWYFDTTKRMCMQFIYGGCRGNKNNFLNFEDCNRVCEIMKSSGDMINRINPNPVILAYAMRDSSVHVDKQQGLVCVPIDSPIVTNGPDKAPAVDCMVTDWTPWSPCSATCGRGRMSRHRMIKVHPQNGGKPCPTRLDQKRKCNLKSCHK